VFIEKTENKKGERKFVIVKEREREKERKREREKERKRTKKKEIIFKIRESIKCPDFGSTYNRK
jgi:hypothetical protein